MPSFDYTEQLSPKCSFALYYSKKEKKPFAIPIVELRRAARERMKIMKCQPKRPIPPPKNGLLVKSHIPVAHAVLNERTTLINNLKKLLKVLPVYACKWCNEINCGSVGHPFKSGRSPQASVRKSAHEWTNAFIEDKSVPVAAFHLFDRLGRRFSISRILALVELCVQAGVDFPEFPTKRRGKPILRIGKSELVDADESELQDPVPVIPKTHY